MGNKTIAVGDYVIASRWSDEDPDDPWVVGFVAEIDNSYQAGPRYRIDTKGARNPYPLRFFPNVRKITAEEGKSIIDGCGPTRIVSEDDRAEMSGPEVYSLLSTHGDPVRIAEGLGELIEAAEVFLDLDETLRTLEDEQEAEERLRRALKAIGVE